jgi:hypothetical protein
MARIRTVKPEFFTSVTVAELTRDARLAWVGLWTHVDDVGRCPDEPRLIKAALFPLDDDLPAEDVEQLLVELAAAGRITRYQVNGRRYLEVVGFRDHQKIDRPRPSKLPPQPFNDTDSNDRRHLDDTSTNRRRTLDTGSGSLDQGSLDQDPDTRTTPRRDDDDALVDRVISRLVDQRATGKRGSYRMTVRSNILGGPELDDIRRACIEAGTNDLDGIVAYHERHRPRYDITCDPPATHRDSLRALDVGDVVPLAATGATS